VRPTIWQTIHSISWKQSIANAINPCAAIRSAKEHTLKFRALTRPVLTDLYIIWRKYAPNLSWVTMDVQNNGISASKVMRDIDSRRMIRRDNICSQVFVAALNDKSAMFYIGIGSNCFI